MAQTTENHHASIPFHHIGTICRCIWPTESYTGVPFATALRWPYSRHSSVCVPDGVRCCVWNSMGLQINAQTETDGEYLKAVVEWVATIYIFPNIFFNWNVALLCSLGRITEAISYRLANVWQRNDVMFNLFGGKWKLKIDNCLHVLHNFSNSIIMKRREELIKHNPPKSDDVGTGKRMALLDILLKSTIDGLPLSNEDIREEVDTFIFEVYCRNTLSSPIKTKTTKNSHIFFDCSGPRHNNHRHWSHLVLDFTP